jgi:hypothetical protein
MKRLLLLSLLLFLLSCSCIGYNSFILYKERITANVLQGANAQETAFALGYPNPMTDAQETAFALGYPNTMTGAQKTAFALGYPNPMTNAQKTAFALGYPPPNSMTDQQKTAFALGYPVPSSQQSSITSGYPLNGKTPFPNTSGYPPNSKPPLPNTSGYPPNSKTPLPNTSGYPPNSKTPLPNASGYPPLPTGNDLCPANQFSTEPIIFVGTDPAPGQAVGPNEEIRVWVNDETPPKIAPHEIVDPITGKITPGDRTAIDGAGNGYFLWEPALYITPLTSANKNGPFSGDAENHGKPYFPTQIKGDYDPNPEGQQIEMVGPPIDTDFINFENGPQNTQLTNKYLTTGFTSEYTWSVNSLGLRPGAYHVELVIHDGDTNLGITCIALRL